METTGKLAVVGGEQMMKFMEQLIPLILETHLTPKYRLGKIKILIGSKFVYKPFFFVMNNKKNNTKTNEPK